MDCHAGETIILTISYYSIRKKNRARRKKRCLTRIILTFFLNNILPSFQKWCTQDTQDYIRNAKKRPKKPPIIFEEAPKCTHFSKNYIFWLNLFKKFILENIFLGLKMKVLPIQIKINAQSPKILYLKALAHSRQSKSAFFWGFSQKVVKTPKKRSF